MQKDGGLICQQPVKLFLSSKIEMQNVIAAARGKPPTSSNPVSNPNQQAQQTNVSQQKRTDSLSQQFTHDIDENQHQQQQQTQPSTAQTNVTNDPMSSFLDVVNKMQQQQQQQQQQKPNTTTTPLTVAAGTTSVLPTPPTATPTTSGLAPANLVLQLLQSNLSNLPPNVLAQVQGQLAGQGKIFKKKFLFYLIQILFRFSCATESSSSTISCSSSCKSTTRFTDANKY
jgi:hypothetical protein